MLSFGRVVILVQSYEEALNFYVEKLGLNLAVDIDAGERRFVHLTFPNQEDAGVWLLKAETEKDKKVIGQQAGDQPVGVMYTSNFEGEFNRLKRAEVEFLEEPKKVDGAVFAHFSDLYGNKFVLVQVEK